MSREFCHIREHPIAGDVIEITEKCTDEVSNEPFDFEVMLRVIAVAEEHVMFKEYGKGRFVISVRQWRERLGKALVGKVFRAGDQDCPF